LITLAVSIFGAYGFDFSFLVLARAYWRELQLVPSSVCSFLARAKARANII